MDYKRLTRKSDDGYELKRELIKSNSYNEFLVNSLELAVNRLADLEDKIENGTLVELPCKVGDTVYILGLKEDSDKLEIFEDTILEILIRYFNDIKVERVMVSKFGIGILPFSEINKMWFLNKAEAEQKLKELEK